MIPRIQFNSVKEKISQNKLLILSGPRAVGKHEMVQQILSSFDSNFLELDARKRFVLNSFENLSKEKLLSVFGNHAFVLIREAQYVGNLQAIIEEIISGDWNLTLILTCSYEPLIDEVLKEVLEMQELIVHIMPPSFYELAQHNGLPVEESLLEKRLIYGNFSQVVNNLDFAELKLKELLEQVVFTNLGVTDRINKKEQLMRMLQILAFEVGETISYNEIGERCGLDNETVERYIDLLEKAYVLIKLPSFFNNHRYELKKSHVIYFTDNGIRNVIINNFNPMILRNDWEQLWKNWVISERTKWNRLNNKKIETYFWKTHTKQVMDYIEIVDQNVVAYKTNWEKRKTLKIPPSFKEAYPFSTTHSLTRGTYWGFLTKK